MMVGISNPTRMVSAAHSCGPAPRRDLQISPNVGAVRALRGGHFTPRNPLRYHGSDSSRSGKRGTGAAGKSTLMTVSTKETKEILDPRHLGYKRNLHERFNVPDPSFTVPLGTGSYGVVNKVSKKSTGEEYAMKSIPKTPPNERESKSPQSYLQKLVSEVKVMQHIGPSLNVVHLYEVFEDETHIHLLLEYCRGGELWTRIKQGDYSEAFASRIMRSVLQIISQCHAKNVIYRDVKPDNFLFLTSDDDSPLKATDFGLATYYKEGEVLSRRCGTPSYLAPEVVLRNYGPEADMWSAGITLYQLLSGRLPFRDSRRATVKDVLRAVVEDPIDLDDKFWTTEISESARDLVKGLLERNPKKRLTAAQALEHPWVNQAGIAPTTPLNGSIVQRLQRYGSFPKLKRQVLRFISPSILENSDILDTVVQAKQLLEIFNRFDYHHSGKLGNEDLLKGLQESGYNVTADEVHQLVSAVDVNGNGEVSYEEFLTTMIDWAKVEQHDAGHFNKCVDDMFDELDIEHRGKIDREEIREVVCSGGISGTECELLIDQAFEQADIDKDGVISRDDFYHLVHTDHHDTLNQYASRARRVPEDELNKSIEELGLDHNPATHGHEPTVNSHAVHKPAPEHTPVPPKKTGISAFFRMPSTEDKHDGPIERLKRTVARRQQD